MGTRSLIRIIDVDGSEICTIYTQSDGYPEGFMLDVAEYLSTRDLVNGITKYDSINGMDDLASQVVTLLKLKHYESIYPILKRHESTWLNNKLSVPIVAGCIYVMKAGTKDVDEEWVYVIRPDEDYEKILSDITLVGAKSKVVIEVYRPKNGYNSSGGLELIWKGYPEDYVKTFGSKP